MDPLRQISTIPATAIQSMLIQKRETKRHYSTVESDLLNSLAWDIFYILSSTVGYKMSTMGYKLYTLSTVGYKLYTLSTMGYKLLYPIVDKKYPTLSY